LYLRVTPAMNARDEFVSRTEVIATERKNRRRGFHEGRIAQPIRIDGLMRVGRVGEGEAEAKREERFDWGLAPKRMGGLQIICRTHSALSSPMFDAGMVPLPWSHY
jgi:hypothetical protein